ncbi:MAG TPA: hypothetical protein VGP93_17760, partial [Polyangiaceae bacterium]|nr:hypothetical protein [Polyangiaceae bacterium]
GENYSGPAPDQSNDYSFGACTSAFVPWLVTPAYENGALVWGTEPDTGGGGGGAGGAGGSSNGGAGGG